MIICLCGSSRFTAEYKSELIRLTMAGHTVVGTPDLREALGSQPPAALEAIREAHLRLIDLADQVHVINPGGYIGDSTQQEIAHARGQGKPATYLEPDRQARPAELDLEAAG
jgi:hypothetical protein